MILNENYINEKLFLTMPEEMKELIRGHFYKMDSLGCSNSKIFIFDNDMVLKIEDKRDESDGEYQMMEWLQGKLPVPKIVKFHSDDVKNYLLMTNLRGKMACDTDILSDVRSMARLLAEGLKKLWKVDISHCPRTINLDYKLNIALNNINSGRIDVDNVEPETFGKNGFGTPMALYEYLRDNRPYEEKVLIHGDYCLPNVFFENNSISGYIDLGYCGIGDKWQDIALAVRSMKKNIKYVGNEGEFHESYEIFFHELGIEADDEKIKYYILLDELF